MHFSTRYSQKISVHYSVPPLCLRKTVYQGAKGGCSEWKPCRLSLCQIRGQMSTHHTQHKTFILVHTHRRKSAGCCISNSLMFSVTGPVRAKNWTRNETLDAAHHGSTCFSNKANKTSIDVYCETDRQKIHKKHGQETVCQRVAIIST